MMEEKNRASGYRPTEEELKQVNGGLKVDTDPCKAALEVCPFGARKNIGRAMDEAELKAINGGSGFGPVRFKRDLDGCSTHAEELKATNEGFTGGPKLHGSGPEDHYYEASKDCGTVCGIPGWL